MSKDKDKDKEREKEKEAEAAVEVIEEMFGKPEKRGRVE